MTPVEFHFITPNGAPIANTVIEIQLSRSSFDDVITGVVLPRVVTATTDTDGKATVNLWPNSLPYYVTVLDTETDAGLSYKFMVPSVDLGSIMRLQDLVVVGDMSPTYYDEVALLAIQNTKAVTLTYKVVAMNASVAALASETAAALSESASGLSETASGLSAASAAASAVSALAHRDAASVSAASVVRDGSGGIAGLTLFKLNLRNAANTFTGFLTNASTAVRTWTLPDKDGTVAMTNDVLTGYAPGAGTVAATDTVLQAIQKIDANNATNANLTGHVTSVGNATVLGSFTAAQLNTAVSDANVVTTTGAETLTNKTLTAPVINGGVATLQLRRGAPITKTASFTLGDAEQWIICNGTASITVTLPSAATNTGRELMLKTIAAFTVISIASNVVPLATSTAGTSILAATAGKWVTLVSDGTNWITTQGN
jgi:hypothetical protein